jgi:hypothetical protein
MIESGTLLIEKHALRPEYFHLVSDCLEPGNPHRANSIPPKRLPDLSPISWASVTCDLSPRDLDKALSAGGWSFLLSRRRHPLDRLWIQSRGSHCRGREASHHDRHSPAMQLP